MAKLPTLLPTEGECSGPATDSVVLAVFAPFGSDKVLSTWPRRETDPQAPIEQQAIVRSLQRVAAQHVHVCALVDLVDDDSWYIEIPAKSPGPVRPVSTWKQDMSHPHSLAGFLVHVQRRFPCSDIVLALEGHGAGYLPEIDGTKLTIENITDSGGFSWTKANDGTTVSPNPPPLSMVSPELSMVSPELPATRLPMSTLGLAKALALAQAKGARRPAVIHFNNCFNLSVELLHTVARHADFATAYANYNFFTAGQAYERVFANLRAAGTTSREQLAVWFAETNRDILDAQGKHPTIGGRIRLADMPALAGLINALATALVNDMVGAIAAGRRDVVVGAIRTAIREAQQYDTVPDFVLEVPDQLTDLRHLAERLKAQTGLAAAVVLAATDLETALSGVRVYGSVDEPYKKPGTIWNFRKPPLAINILCPDPDLQGIWDWRSPYYIDSRRDPGHPSALAEDIPFLKQGTWVDFVIEYHRKIDFKRYLPARAPVFPVFIGDDKGGGGPRPRPKEPPKRPRSPGPRKAGQGKTGGSGV